MSFYDLLKLSSQNGSAGSEKRTKTKDLHSVEKSKTSVATPLPDRTVSLKKEPSLLSPDFDQERAMTEAKFKAFEKGMKQMEEEKD